MPRLLIVIVSYLATSSFLVWIMFHKEEPKDWSLSDFMAEAAYPSVSCLWPVHQRLHHSQWLDGKHHPSRILGLFSELHTDDAVRLCSYHRL